MDKPWVEYDKKVIEARFYARQQSCSVEHALMVEVAVTQDMQYCELDGPVLTVYSRGLIPGHPCREYDISEKDAIHIRVEKWPDEIYEHIHLLGINRRMVRFRPETQKALWHNREWAFMDDNNPRGY